MTRTLAIPASLFDLDAGRHQRDIGCERVLSASERWRAGAMAAIERLAQTTREFTSDDVRAAITEEPQHFNAFGALFLSAAKRGWIERTGRTAISKRVAAHAHSNPVWASKIFQG